MEVNGMAISKQKRPVRVKDDGRIGTTIEDWLPKDKDKKKKEAKPKKE